MQKRKGFTLVELVIVIAVIAILAGVLIGTFASVINKANESAKMQELKAQEHEQKANDLLKKIEDSNWYGWEDFEKSIVEKITAAIDKVKPGTTNVTLDSDAVSKAVNEAMTKYYAEHAMGNTSLTEDQVKAIIENALGSFKFSGVTSEQVKTIVETAVSKMSTGLTAAQVQKIVNAAADRVEGGQLTVGQITTIVANAFAENKVDTTGLATSAQVEAIVTAIGDKTCSTLTAQEVETIVNAAVKSAGSTAWVTAEEYADPTKTSFKVTSAEEVRGLATLVNAGYDFEGKTIELKPTDTSTNTLALDTTKDWTPIGNSYETQFKGTLQGSEDPEAPLVVSGLTLSEQFNAVINGILINCSSTGNMDKVGVGFVAYLGEGAVLENIVFENVAINIADDRMDGISVGVAVGYLDGGTIKNVTVKSGTVSSYYRVGGLVGAASHGKIEGCKVEAGVTITSTGSAKGDAGYHNAAGLIGYLRNFEIKFEDSNATNLPLRTVTVKDTTVATTNISSAKGQSWKLVNVDNNAVIAVEGTTTENTKIS